MNDLIFQAVIMAICFHFILLAVFGSWEQARPALLKVRQWCVERNMARRFANDPYPILTNVVKMSKYRD